MEFAFVMQFSLASSYTTAATYVLSTGNLGAVKMGKAGDWTAVGVLP